MDIVKFLDVRRVILIILAIVFLFTFIFDEGELIPVEKRCTVDEDCNFVKTVCCPGCSGGFDSLNVKYAKDINFEMSEQCKDKTCPPLFCETEVGSAYVTKPVCENTVCTSKSELQCTAICTYFDKKDKNPFNVYLENAAEIEGVRVVDIALFCRC